jgi:predicted glycoside hydrolase/deacetylase ChbG (UPF0249 family)
MHSNAALVQLGFSPDDRVVILHADDLGMCHAANAAFATLLESGLTVSGSVMVPCPWFPEVAAFGRAHPEADLGVHLTLNSEYPRYRWGPISTRDPDSGLLDTDGYLPRTVEALHGQMSSQAAVVELRAQVDRAQEMGLDITHIDTHMGAVIHPELFGHYVALALEYRVPGLFPRLTPELAQSLHLDQQMADAVESQLGQLEAAGFPLVDHVSGMPLQSPESHVAHLKRALDSVQPGLTHFVLHPAAPGAEIEAITGDAGARVANFQMLASEELPAYLQAAGIHAMGYRRLREVMRAAM